MKTLIKQRIKELQKEIDYIQNSLNDLYEKDVDDTFISISILSLQKQQEQKMYVRKELEDILNKKGNYFKNKRKKFW